MVWQNPKTDWVANPKSPVGEDFNRIEGNIAFLKDDIATRFLNVQTEIETKKGLIVDAINDVDPNQSAEVTDTYAELAQKIKNVSLYGTGKLYFCGAEGVIFREGYKSGTGSLTKTATYLQAASGNGEAYYETSEPISLAGISQILVAWSVTGGGRGRLFLTTAPNQSYAARVRDLWVSSSENAIRFMNVSDLSGEYYIVVGAGYVNPLSMTVRTYGLALI